MGGRRIRVREGCLAICLVRCLQSVSPFSPTTTTTTTASSLLNPFIFCED